MPNSPNERILYAPRAANEAERYLYGAVKAIEKQAKATGLSRTGQSALLETLFHESPFPDLPNLSFSDKYAEEMAAYQIGRSDVLLKERVAASWGFADPDLVVIDVFHNSSRYTYGLLKKIAWCIAALFGDEGVAWFIDLAAKRFFGLTRRGLAGVDIPESELRCMYAEQMDWHKDNGARDSEKRSVSSGSRGRRMAVVVGCLPLLDNFDIAVAACAQQVLPRAACPIAQNHNEHNENALLNATNQAICKILSGKEYLLTPEEYWRKYTEFMAATATEHNGPPHPGRYRALFDERQELRNFRLRLLASYTGLRRANATEQDHLASPYPLFFRMAEELIRHAGAGVVALASPSGYLSEKTAEKMRKQLCAGFSSIEVTEMRGVGPEENAVAGLPEGATINYAVSNMMMRRKGSRAVDGGNPTGEVWYLNNPHGSELNFAKLSRIPSIVDLHAGHKAILPSNRNGYAFRPPEMAEEYLSWPSIIGIYQAKVNGIMEKRGGALIDADEYLLIKRMRAYFDASLSWEEYDKLGFGMVKEQSRFNPKMARREVQRKEGGFDKRKIRPYLLKPFDVRWCYYTATRPLWHEPRPELAELQRSGNHFLVVRSNRAVDDEGVPFFFTSFIGDDDLLRGHTYFVPAWLTDDNGKRTMNLSGTMRQYLDALGILRDTTIENAALLVHYHILAIGFSPAYLHENRMEIGQEWPRIPFPGFGKADANALSAARAAFLNSTNLGRHVAALLTGDAQGKPEYMLDSNQGVFAVLTDTGATSSGRMDEVRFELNQGWGRLFRNGEAVLPSHGKVSVREYSADERRALEALAQTMGTHAGAAYCLVGDSTRDIFLNERICLRNIPAKVWDYTIGGYPVLKKWLSYREAEILGRPLTIDEVDGFSAVIRRIVTLQLMGFHLNRNYAIVRDLHCKDCISARK